MPSSSSSSSSENDDDDDGGDTIIPGKMMTVDFFPDLFFALFREKMEKMVLKNKYGVIKKSLKKTDPKNEA